MPTKAERLVELCRRLAAAAPATHHDAAFVLLRDTLNAVEDELCGIPFDPIAASMRIPSERMYPPLADSEIPSIIVGTRCFVTVQHQIFISANGAILIRNRHTLNVALSKSGADGKAILP